MSGLAPETGGVVAGCCAGLAYRCDLEDGVSQAPLTIGPPAEVRVEVIGADGKPVGAGVPVTLTADYADFPYDAWLDLRWSHATSGGGRPYSPVTPAVRPCETDAAGRIGPICLPPGLWQVDVDGAEPVRVSLAFGEHREVTIQFPGR